MEFALALRLIFMLNKPKRLRRTLIPQISPKPYLEKIADRLEKNSFLRIWIRINQSLALFALVVAAVGFTVALKKFDVDEVKADEDRVAKAWDVVSRMTGKQSNGGQVSALEKLNTSGISLNFIDLHNTFAANVNLRGAKLRNANLSGANLEGSDLTGADLVGADLTSATLIGAKLSGADMTDAKFRDAKLAFAKVDLTIALAADLRDADLTAVTSRPCKTPTTRMNTSFFV